ncbi:hypothetical protein F0L74_33120 [Chitinophaga agrisoli]|uniref:Anaphylatoxin-like domain-containing protein n=1 Tax=Chitinophaga agrisoli TaxID=2607653 RepID=A0A5B2V5N8_9BACT|nr:hypothetical protein F0L74_33120 [Chitinophaga agrisoli]
MGGDWGTFSVLIFTFYPSVGKYANTQKQCCADGLKQKRVGYTCERKATFILDGAECVQCGIYYGEIRLEA